MGRTIYEQNCKLVSEEGLRSGLLPQGCSYPLIQIPESFQTPRSAANPGSAVESTEAEAPKHWSRDLLETCQKQLQVVKPYTPSWIFPSPGLIGQQSTPQDDSAVPAFAWHPYHQVLAASDGAQQVHIYTVQADTDRSSPESSDPFATLANTHQHEVRALAWRPNSPSALAVGSSQGVCLWTVPLPAGPSGSVAGGAAAMTFLRSEAHPASALSWSPDGQLLAAGSATGPGILIWNVALGTYHRIQADLSATALLSWSPNGSYLFASPPAASSFRLWSTGQWASVPFSSAQHLWHTRGVRSGASQLCRVTSACWDGSGKLLLVSFEGCCALAAVHMTGGPTSLDCQLLPLQLPDISDNVDLGVGAIAWDPHGERLAVALLQQQPHYNKLALFATDRHPLLTAKLVGWIDSPSEEELGDLPVSADGEQQAQSSAAAVSFLPSFAGGALLAVRYSTTCISILPLMYTTFIQKQ